MPPLKPLPLSSARGPPGSAGGGGGFCYAGSGATGPGGAPLPELFPEVDTPQTNRSNATRRDPEDWANHTMSHISDASAVRQEVRDQLRRDVIVNGSAEEPSIGGPAVEDKLKQRARTTQSWLQALVAGVERMQQSIFSVRQRVSELNRAAGGARLSLSVVDKRLELREKRPPEELTQDAFNEALVSEGEALRRSIEALTGYSQSGRTLMTHLQDSKSEMHQSRLTVHLDRSGRTQEQLGHAASLERSAAQFCTDTAGSLRDYERKAEKARARTTDRMKKRIAETLALKVHLENDLAETDRTIYQLERHLERQQKRLGAALAMPERKLNLDGDFSNAKLAAQSDRLMSIRSKIKSAAYTGTSGRQLDTVFGRFDRDGSGVLDEDEVRMALRKSCKIPPSVISDAEISVFCNLLDEDHSGSVCISEMVDFLTADMDVAVLQEQCSITKGNIERLRSIREHTLSDLRNKTVAWRIDEACRLVTPIRGLELDQLASPGRSASSGHGRPVTAPVQKGAEHLPSTNASPGRKRPLDPAVLERVRLRIRASASTGHAGKELNTIFGRFDKDSSGILSKEELRVALRKTLRIPPSVLSDADIGALCAALDADSSGSVSVAELVEFVSKEPAGSSSKKCQPGKPSSNNGGSISTRSAPWPLGEPPPRGPGIGNPGSSGGGSNSDGSPLLSDHGAQQEVPLVTAGGA